MSLSNLSVKDLFTNMSNAFVGVLADIGRKEDVEDQTNDSTLKLLMKENRYMYLALLVLLLMITANVLFS